MGRVPQCPLFLVSHGPCSGREPGQGWVGWQIDQGCRWVGVQKERFHLPPYSYATGCKARAGSPPQHLGDGGSFVGALEGSVVGGPGLLEAQWLEFPLASSPPALPRTPRFPSDLHLPPPSTFQTMSPPNPKVHRIFQARMLGWVAMSYSRVSFQPRNQTPVSCTSCTSRRSFII